MPQIACFRLLMQFLGQFGAGFGAILRVFWGSTGQYWGVGLVPVLGAGFGGRFEAKKKSALDFSNALFHFPKVKINGQTAIFQGIVSECLE